MPVEILKASVGDYSVNTSKRGVTVNQQYLGDRDHSWGPALPVHKWYLANPKATVAQVAEQLDKLPKEVTVRGYKIGRDDWGDLYVIEPFSPEKRNPSLYPDMTGDPCIQYLRKHYNGNKSTDIAECARLIEEYFNPREITVQGYKVFKEGKSLTVQDLTGWKCNPGSQKTRVARGTDCPVIAYLRTVMTPETTVRETAKLIEDFLAKQEITVRGVRVYRGAGSSITGTDGAHSIPGLFEYLESKSKNRLSVAEVAKLIEEYKFTKVTVETEDGKKEFNSVNEAVEFTKGKEVTCRFSTECLDNRWYLTQFGNDFGVLFNTGTKKVRKVRNIEEAKQYIRDTEIPF